jgi:hypothetical protein
MLRAPPRRIGRAGCWLRVVLVVVAVAPPQARPQLLGQHVEDLAGAAILSVQLRCWSRPTTTTRLPLASDSAACSAWSRHTITVNNDAS